MLKQFVTFFVISFGAQSAFAATTQQTTTTLVAQPAQTSVQKTTTTTTTTTTSGLEPWDYNAGGLIAGTFTLHLDMNTELSPEFGFAYACNRMFEIGLQVQAQFNHQYGWAAFPVTLGLSPGVIGQVPLRFGLVNDGKHSFAIKITPGLGVYANQEGTSLPAGMGQYSFLIGGRIAYGYWAIPRTLQIGAAIQTDVIIVFSPVNGVIAPLNAGLNAEYNFTEHFALYGEARVGPYFDSFHQFGWSQAIFFGLAAHP